MRNFMKHFLVVLLLFALFGASRLHSQSTEDLSKLHFMDIRKKMDILGARVITCSPAQRPALQAEYDRWYNELKKREKLNAKLNEGISEGSRFMTELEGLFGQKKEQEIYFLIQKMNDKKVEPQNLFQYYTASSWVLWNLHDSSKALALAQMGISKADEFIAQGNLDISMAGDGQVLMEKCRLLKAKTQVLSAMGRLNEAKATADEMMKALFSSFSNEKTAECWKDPSNYGFITLFPLTMSSVMQVANRIGGEQEASALIPWVEAGLATQTLMLEKIGEKLENMKPMMENYKKIGIQVHGEALLLAGQATESLKILEKYTIDPSLNLNYHSYLIYVFMIKGRALAAVGKFDSAIEQMKKAVEIAENITQLQLFVIGAKWMPFAAIGEIFEKAGKPDNAIESLKKALEIMRDIYGNMSLASIRREMQKETDKIYARLIRLLVGQGKIQEALDGIEESHSKNMIDLFEDVSKGSKQNWDRKLIEKFEGLKRELLELEKKESSPDPGDGGKKRGEARGDPKRLEALRAKKLELRTQYENLVQEAQKKSLKDMGSKDDSMNRWQATLQGKAHFSRALVENLDFKTIIFQVREDPCWVFVLGDGKTLALKLSITAEEVKNLSALTRQGIISEDDDWKENSQELYKAIFQPLEPMIGGAKKILIIPDGFLWYVPFSALVDSGGKPLIDRFTLGVVSGIPLAAALIKKKTIDATATQTRLLILADPDESLPSAQIEGENIARLFEKSDKWKASFFSRKDATEARFRAIAAAKEYSSLHFATHGILDEINPFASFLLLHPSEGQDGRLEIFEIANEINLKGIRLAVLSACNSAMGTVSGGNEMICMQQAFHEAGVPNILGSLWEVSDEATSKLMTNFYSNLLAKKSNGEALALSIRAMQTEHPFRWAPFQLYGLP